MAVGDIIEAKVGCFDASLQAGLNIRHYRIGTQTNPGLDLPYFVAAGELTVILSPLYKALLSVQAAYMGVSIRRLSPLPATNEFADTALAGPGLVAGDQLPTQVAGLITFRGIASGIAGRGRIYVPFPGEEDSSPGGVTTTDYQNRLQALANAWANTLVVTEGVNQWELDPIILRRATFEFQELITGIARIPWATQRRRGGFGKTNSLPF
jgi:hypothetical protein